MEIRNGYENTIKEIKKRREKKRKNSEKKQKTNLKEVGKEYFKRNRDEILDYRKEIEQKDRKILVIQTTKDRKIAELEVKIRDLHTSRKNLKKNLEEQIRRKENEICLLKKSIQE